MKLGDTEYTLYEKIVIKSLWS